MSAQNHIAEPRPDLSLLVRISKGALTLIENHAQKEYPYECCGFLFGNEDEGRSVQEARPVSNQDTENRRRRFEISSEDYLKAELYAQENGLTLLGVYHSHPDHPAVPSIHDFNQAVPYFSYIIVSTSSDHVVSLRSWQLNESLFTEERIESINP